MTSALIVTFSAGFVLGLFAYLGKRAVKVMFEGLRI
jgi:hypothetical protein